MKCESCGKQASANDPVNVVSDSEDNADYMLVCDVCLRDPEKWIPGAWERVIDNTGVAWWTCHKKEQPVNDVEVWCST